MASHRRRTKYFSRKFNARKALLRGLVTSLVEHERIQTTVEKAKELRRHVEKAITLGKRGGLASRRLLLSRLANPDAVEKIVSNIADRFKERSGGYTRIIKIGRRPGDTAEMAFIEFVDFDFRKFEKKATSGAGAKGKASVSGDAKASVAKTTTRASKEIRKRFVEGRKARRRIQARSRAENRA